MAKKLLDQMRDALSAKHYSYRTEVSYISWVRQLILFHKKRHHREMGVAEISAFITHLVTDRDVAASTHTAPAVAAGGTRPSVPSSSSTATSSISNSMKPRKPPP